MADAEEQQKRDAKAAIDEWYALQEKQKSAYDESNRLGELTDNLQTAIEAIEKQWQQVWDKFGLYR